MLGNDGLKVALAAGVLLLTFVMTVLAAVYPTFPFDERGLAQVQGLRADWLDVAAVVLDKAGRAPMGSIPAAVVVFALLALRRPTDALVLTISLLALLGGDVVKELVNRPRPEHALYLPSPESPAFPSGHSAYAMVLCSFSFCVVGSMARQVWLKRILQAALAAVLLAMGASRVYLGVHWPSDVVGGYLWGIMVLVVVAFLSKVATCVFPKITGRRRPP